MRLRPFVASQGLVRHLLTDSPAEPPAVDATTPFQALCSDVLGARVAYLVALGPLSPLADPPLIYPPGTPAPLLSASVILTQLTSPQVLCVPLDPAQHSGAFWAVGLWSERGLIGVLLLGEKQDGSLYTQEEIEIARASGERLLDLRASAELARRLMALQRQQLAESQVLDRQARRVLHDDVLPRLHAALLALSREHASSNGASRESIALLADIHRQISDLLREMPRTVAAEVARMGLVGTLRCVVEEEYRGAFDGVSWEIEPEAVDRIETIAPLTAEVIFHAAREAIRNAALHGRHADVAQALHLRIAFAWRNGLEVCIEDDGAGLMSAGHASGGSGQGLALHSTMLAVIGGALAVESEAGVYTRVVLTLPVGDSSRVSH